jgi:SnoaL-like domain
MEKSGMVGEKDPREVVLACIDALNRDDFEQAKTYISEDLLFVGVLGSRRGAEAYFRDMEPMHIRYSVKKVLVEGKDVSVFYDLNLSGATLLGSAWYEVESGKIQSLRVVFDPRPLLKGKAA